MKADAIASIGSTATGMLDFGVGNFVSFLNFLHNYRAAHHARLVGEKVQARKMAWISGEQDWYKKEVTVPQEESMQAVWADLLPFGIGENVGEVMYPAPPARAPGKAGKR